MFDNDKIIKFGIIGCGRISRIHTAVISKLSGTRLMAVCDIIEKRAGDYAEKFKCESYKDYKELLKSKNIDIVNICTPTYLHADMTVAAAEFGKHVIVEKPMALSLKDADRMIEACERSRVKLFVVKQNRYNPPILNLKEAIDEGRFGKLFYGNATVFWHRDQSYYDEQSWFRERDKGGGVIINQASHNIDMLQWLMGPVESVYSKIDTKTHNIPTEDFGLAVLKFKNGAWGTVIATTSIFSKNLEGSVTIFGENGSAKVGGIQMNEMQIWEFKDYRTEDGIDNRHSIISPDVYGFGHIRFMEDVLRVLRGENISFVDGMEAKASLELILAMYESASSGKEIRMSDFIANYKKNRNRRI